MNQPTSAPPVSGFRGQLLRLLPNRVWRTYAGGRTLDAMEGRPQPVDGPFPEDWIGSTTRAVNPQLTAPDEGLSRASFGEREAYVADLIAADPAYFLGEAHVARYGTNPMVLVKYLDASVRLPIQVHPTVAFSRARLKSESGKTEAYYVLATRPETVEPSIYLGFQRPPSRAELRRMIVDQDIAALERCFEKIPVRPGEVFLVPGGLPHAIGAGILLVEILEPTDFVARVEFNCAGRVVPESARFMGRDVEFALDMFSLEPCPVDAVRRQWCCQPRVLATTAALSREALVDDRVTDRFRVTRSIIRAETSWRAYGFTILLVVEGAARFSIGGVREELRTFDRVLVPSGLGELTITPTSERVVLLECLPPAVSAVVGPSAAG